MLNKLKKLFNKVSVEEAANADLEQAKRDLYTAQTNAELWNHEIVYQTTRLQRLNALLAPPKASTPRSLRVEVA